MKTFAGIIATICASALLVGLGSAQDPKGAKDQPKAKPNVVEIDLSKLPPEVAKKILDSLQAQSKDPAAKPAPKAAPVKTITLIEAITIAEKNVKGEAVKAERKGEGAETHFKIDVLTKEGKKTKVELGPDGKTIDKK